MQQEFLNNQGQPYIKWEFDAENNWLYLNWIGYISKANGNRAMRHFLKLMKEHHYPYVLNDNRQVLGPWGGGLEGNFWLENCLFPKAIKAGLRYFAHVLSPGIASALLAQDLHQRVSGLLHMQIFGDLEKAQAWLKTKQLQNPGGSPLKPVFDIKPPK